MKRVRTIGRIVSLIWAAAVGSCSPAWAQDASISERVRAIVDERYADAPEDQRRVLRDRLVQVFLSRQAVPAETLARLVGRLNHSILYVRSYVHPYDPRAQGDESFPALPKPLKSRQYELEFKWLETYYRKGMEAKPLAPESRDLISNQVDYLLTEARSIMSTRINGAFAFEAIDQKLHNTRQHLLATFDGPVSSDFPRLMSHDEVSAILQKMRERALRLESDIEVSESLNSIRDQVQVEARGTDARKSQDEQARKLNRIMEAMDELTKPLWGVLDLWSPELVQPKADLEQLSKEVQSWRLETIERMNSEARKPVDSVVPNRASVTKTTEAPTVDANPSTKMTVKKDPERTTNGGGRPSWLLKSILTMSVLLGVAILYKLLRRNSARTH